MSFSSDIKNELIKIEDMPECCVHSMAYGMLLFGRSFNLTGISLMTDYNGVADKYTDVIEKASGIKATKTVSEAGKITVDFPDSLQRKAVLAAFSSSGNERTMRIDRGNLSNEGPDSENGFGCCDAAFLRGAFLACGTASDPNKSYHIEFVVPFKTLSLDLLKLLTEYGLKAKHMVRRYVNVIYIKDSESIEDLLTIMGATNASMEIMNIKIYKDIRNLTNRRNNFESANLLRTADAAFDQVSAIEHLKKCGVFATLTDDLRQVAQLRIDNEDSSLREIGEMCSPPMSRSAVNHRLKRLIAISDKLKEEGNNTNE